MRQQAQETADLDWLVLLLQQLTVDHATKKLSFQSTTQITGEIFPVLSIQKMSPEAVIKHTGASCWYTENHTFQRMVIHLKWRFINHSISLHTSEAHKQLRSSFPTSYNPNKSLQLLFDTILLSLLKKECSLANPHGTTIIF